MHSDGCELSIFERERAHKSRTHTPRLSIRYVVHSLTVLIVVLLLILFIIEKSTNKNHIFSHTFGYYCRIYFDKQLICMANKLWRLHDSSTNGQCRYKYQNQHIYIHSTQIKSINDSPQTKQF